MRKRLLPLALACLLALGGCGTDGGMPPPTPSAPLVTPAPGPAAEFALPRTGGSLHPILSRDRVNLAFSGLVWEGLFALDRSFTPQNVLCQESAVSEDGLLWTFTLRGDAAFSDGSPLTAGDVVYSLNLARGVESRFAPRLAGIQSVGEESGAVAVALSAPNGALPALLDVPIVRGEGETPLGTGPYALEGEEKAQVLAARGDWWQRKSVPVGRIPLRHLPEADDLISAFDAGSVCLVTADLTGTSALGYSGSYEVWDYPTSTLLFVGFNTAKGPCADPALRRALVHGFDRNTVAGALYARHAEAACLPVSPASPLYHETAAAGLAYSPQALAQMLEEAGYEKNDAGLLVSGRKGLSLTFVVNTDNSFRVAAAEYLAAELTKAGVTVELKKLPWSDYEKALAAGQFDLYLGETRMTADFDPSPLIASGGILNSGKYHDTETDALLAAFRAASGAARETAASALYVRLGQEVPVAPLCFKNQSVLTQWGQVAGVSPTQQDAFYKMEEWKITS